MPPDPPIQAKGLSSGTGPCPGRIGYDTSNDGPGHPRKNTAFSRGRTARLPQRSGHGPRKLIKGIEPGPRSRGDLGERPRSAVPTGGARGPAAAARASGGFAACWPDANPLESDARRTLLSARRLHVENRTVSLQRELGAYDAERPLLPHRRDLAARDVASL